jgi:ABC-type nitrate/sulfonate/bicarbonate transport system substrate-binding protein
VLSGALLDFLPVFASDNGYFAKNGIKVQFVYSTNGPALATTLASGSADFGSASPPLVFPAMAKGVPIVFLTANDGYTYNLVARTGLSLPGTTWQERLKDLAGKTVGVTALGSLFQVFVQLLMAKAGMAPGSITFIAVGGDSTAIPALEHGKVDAIVTSAPYEQIMGPQNFQYVVNDVQNPTGVTTGGIVDGFAALRSYVNSHTTVVNAVCKSLWQASTYVHDPANLNAVAAFIAKFQNLTVAQATAVWKEYGHTYNLALTPSAWAIQGSFLPSSEHVPSFPYSTSVYAPCATGSVAK